MRKRVFGVSDKFRHKPGCTASENGYRLEMSDFANIEGLYYPYSENKGADQLRSYCAGDLRLCFRICKSAGFLITRLKLYDSYEAGH